MAAKHAPTTATDLQAASQALRYFFTGSHRPVTIENIGLREPARRTGACHARHVGTARTAAWGGGATLRIEFWR
jgi:hypothetical protein